MRITSRKKNIAAESMKADRKCKQRGKLQEKCFILYHSVAVANARDELLEEEPCLECKAMSSKGNDGNMSFQVMDFCGHVKNQMQDMAVKNQRCKDWNKSLSIAWGEPRPR